MALAMVRERALRHVCQLGLQQRLWSVLEQPVACSLERGFATHGVSDASSRMGLVKFYKTVGVRPAGVRHIGCWALSSFSFGFV